MRLREWNKEREVIKKDIEVVKNRIEKIEQKMSKKDGRYNGWRKQEEEDIMEKVIRGII